MALRNDLTMSWDEARAVLGVAADASEEQMRAAYLDQVRQHPPDRDPQNFERIRDAFEQLRNPRLRANQVLNGPDPHEPLTSFVDALPPARRFVGAQPWIDLLKASKEGGA